MNPNSNRKRGKANERALAKRLNCQRIGLLGKEDLQHSTFSIEVKSFVRFAGERIIEQAERNASQGKTPLAIVHIKNKNRDNDIVMIRLKNWEEWYGRLQEANGDN